MRRIRRALSSGAVFAGLLLVCLWFVGWIGRLAFDNTCIDLKKQYIRSAAAEVVDEIETGVRFGKSLDSFYGMDQLLDRFCELAPDHLEAAVMGADGELLYHTLGGGNEGRDDLARLLSGEFQSGLYRLSGGREADEVSFGAEKSLVWGLFDQDGNRLGSVALMFDQNAFRNQEASSGTGTWGILMVLAAAVTGYYLYRYSKRRSAKKWDCLVPVAAVMAGILIQICFLYGNYRQEYESLIYENAKSIAAEIGEKADEMVEKGLPPEEFHRIEGYFAKKASDSDTIWNIRVTRPYTDTSKILDREDGDTIAAQLRSSRGAEVLVTVNRSFIDGQLGKMTLSFLVIFVICFMVSFELVKIIEILENRQEQAWEAGTGVSRQIKLITFVTYTGMYASMPYAAVLMRTWNASVFHLPAEISASLPLTLELLGVTVWSSVLSKVGRRLGLIPVTVLSMGILIVGNAGCALAGDPYVLLAMRGVTSLGFAMFKYLMNSVVAAGSPDGNGLSSNFAQMNAGVLGGITVGGAIGAIVAEAQGYQFNYYFTAGIILAGLLGSLCLLPWNRLRTELNRMEGQSGKSGVRLSSVLKSREVASFLLLGAVPLNIGLMYIVAFLPVYMNNAGQSALAVSYAYLVNGICGVYVGVWMVRLLSRLPGRISVFCSMVLAAAGILVLTVSRGLGAVMLSAGIMGLFDGYGTPNVTGYFTSIPEVRQMDTAQALTVFGTVGNAIQIICPLLYNVTIQMDGRTGYITMLGLGYAGVAAAVLFLKWSPQDRAGSCMEGEE